jgi:hypothetical protein
MSIFASKRSFIVSAFFSSSVNLITKLSTSHNCIFQIMSCPKLY